MKNCLLNPQLKTLPGTLLILLAFVLLAAPHAPAQNPDKGSEKAAQADKADKSDKDGKKESDSGITNLKIEVVAGEKNAPVAQASVYVKYMESRAMRRDKKVELNLKTNVEGVTRLPDAPRGKVLIQVIAPGWKTFGQWYDLDQAEQTIKIQLQKPPRWY